MEARQLINVASRTSKTSSTAAPTCSAFTLPSDGILKLNATTTITLSSDAIYQPSCNDSSDVIIVGAGSADYIHFRDPFYASTLPECYALAATTMIAYMLVIILLITPGKLIHEGSLGRRAFTNRHSGNNGGFGIGGRPWLQKAAALAVAISLTIATADTFKVAESQYEVGYMDAEALQKKVENGMELKTVRVISDAFLWLAQAQTLVRLFPRQREKIIIKWTAFALITLDELFSILNAFAYKGSSRPRSFVDAVPALAYLFQLALSLLYAAWVIHYSITKKAFAFYHPQMKNICIVALLSLVSVLVPVAFFITDVSKPDVAGWGNYVRWVGAAAASVVVWEWVERIEALERNDIKDGVLGREVFDGDEMLYVNASPDSSHDNESLETREITKRRKRSNQGLIARLKKIEWPIFNGLNERFLAREKLNTEPEDPVFRLKRRSSRTTPCPTKPLPIATSDSMVDTSSVERNFYAIEYLPINEEISSNLTERDQNGSLFSPVNLPGQLNLSEENKMQLSIPTERQASKNNNSADLQNCLMQDSRKENIMKDKGKEPPRGVSSHTTKQDLSSKIQNKSSKWKIRARLENYAASRANKINKKKSQSSVCSNNLPKTIIPAPPRRTNLAATFLELGEHD
ncbi:pH-response regulator protein palH/RIM21 [Golovinomyces cichoracearum]|uniref:pH-response regulator protein palH/RIM21 n=1 Tax=Golovinomyces cichoracearum TaxID=62708 RepID=A0A420J0Q2_9PEZI|nr:pH-response regulator protein palH/RIM21 [Golovinomyces cichoracearum]